MYGIAGYAFPFFVTVNKKISPANAPNVTNSAGINPNALMKTPAVIIGKITSPPPRIARLTLNFCFFILLGIFLFLYFVLIFCILSFTFFDVDGIRNPPNTFISSI